MTKVGSMFAECITQITTKKTKVYTCELKIKSLHEVTNSTKLKKIRGWEVTFEIFAFSFFAYEFAQTQNSYINVKSKLQIYVHVPAL